MAVIDFSASCVNIVDVPIVITTSATFSVVEGSPLSIALTATGGAGTIQWTFDAVDQSIYDFDPELKIIEWIDDEAQAADDYILTVTADDGLGNSASLEITVTVTAAPVTLPGAIATLTATPINSTTVVIAHTASADATSYWYSVDGSAEAELPADLRLRAFSALTDYELKVWGRNDDGDGPVKTASFTTLAQSQPVVDLLVGKQTSESDLSTYTFPFTVQTGAASNFLLFGIVTQSTTAHRVAEVSFNSIDAIEVESTSDTAANLQVGYYRVPWGAARTGGTYNLSVTLRDSALGSVVTGIRCVAILKHMRGRPSTPLNTYVDTSGALSQSVTMSTDDVVETLTAALADNNTIDLAADLNRLTRDNNTEGKLDTLNYASGYFSPSAGETRTIGADWVDPSAATTSSLPRMVVVQYDEPSAPVSTGITPVAADSLVDTWGIDTHGDWHRSEATGHGKSWHWGSHSTPQITNLISTMGELGVRFYRMGPSLNNSTTLSNVNSQNYKYAKAWYDDYGMQAFGPVGDEAMTLTEQETYDMIESTEQVLNSGGKRRFYAYEGPNESNHGRPLNWNTKLVQRTQWMDFKVRQYDGAKIIGPSIWGRNTWDIDTLKATPGWDTSLFDYGTLHTYNGARKPTLSGAPLFNGSGDDNAGDVDIPYRDTLLEHNGLYDNLPLWITETGFKRGNPQGYKNFTIPDTWVLPYAKANVTMKTYMKYILRYYMASVEINSEFGELGMFSPYIYQDDVESQPNFCFGITYANQAKTSLNLLPSYYTIKRFLNMFREKTFNYSAGAWQYPSGAPTLTPLNYTITGVNEFTRPIMWNQSQRGRLYRKSNDQYLIPLYQDVESWRRSKTSYTPADPADHFCPADRDIARHPVTFNAGQVCTKIEWFEPTFDNSGTYPNNGGYGTASTATARKTVNNSATIDIDVPDHVGVIVVTP